MSELSHAQSLSHETGKEIININMARLKVIPDSSRPRLLLYVFTVGLFSWKYFQNNKQSHHRNFSGMGWEGVISFDIHLGRTWKIVCVTSS